MQRFCGAGPRAFVAEDTLRSVFPLAGFFVDLYVHGTDAQAFAAVDAFAFVTVDAQQRKIAHGLEKHRDGAQIFTECAVILEGKGQRDARDVIERISGEEQAVTMLWRFAKQQGFDTTQGGMAIREYNDYDSLSEYAREAMAWAVNTEILKGSNNRLLPDAACTRAQLVTLLYRLESQTTDTVNYSGDVTGWMYAPENKDPLVDLLVC